MLLSLSEIEKIVCLTASFKVYWLIITGSFLSIIGRQEKSSADLPIIVNLAFSQVIVVLKFPSDSMVISLSGSFLTISKKILASKAMIPFCKISPSIVVSIPNSISFAVSVMESLEAFKRIHSRIDMVVLLGTALETVCTPDKRLAFEQINFICE